MIQKVAFTCYPVVDWKRARTFYGETLGLAIGSSSPDGVWTEYDLPGGGCLALFCGKEMTPNANAAQIALEVDDLDKLNAELKAKGVEYAADMIHSPVCRMSVIRDTEGNSIILHELKPKS